MHSQAIRSILSSCLVVAGLMLGERTAGCGDPEPIPQDPYESNDNQAEAVPIKLDFVASDANVTAGDEDWYSFTLEQSMGVTIEATPTSGIDALEISLLNSNGVVLESGFSNFGIGLGAPLTAGTWYVRVTGHISDDTTITYELAIADEPLEDDIYEENDTSASAVPITLDFRSDDLCLAYVDDDWFRFVLDDESYLYANIYADRFIYLILYDQNYSQLRSTYNNGDYYSTGFELLIAPGIYYIRVSASYYVDELKSQVPYGLEIQSD